MKFFADPKLSAHTDDHFHVNLEVWSCHLDHIKFKTKYRTWKPKRKLKKVDTFYIVKFAYNFLNFTSMLTHLQFYKKISILSKYFDVC